MRVLFLTPVFAPSRGGVETVAERVASGLMARGHEVRVTTETPADGSTPKLSYEVVRCPSGRELRRLFRWAEVVWHHQICLGMLIRSGRWPRPMAATFHTWLPTSSLRSRLRRTAAARFQARYGVSQAIAQHLPSPAKLLRNSYDPHCFFPATEERRWDFGCVARLVSDKGVDLFIEAIARLKRDGRECRGAIVGDGPELPTLRELAARARLDDRLDFFPAMSPGELAAFYRRCGWLVVPSRWAEPFGLVALESLACGTPVLAADHGGLPEAAGPCARYFKPGDAEALARVLREVGDGGDELRSAMLQNRDEHLARFDPESQIDAYEAALVQLVRTGRRG